MRGGGTVRLQIWRRSSVGREENEVAGLLDVSDSEFSIDEHADFPERDHPSIFSMLG
jgi:hypothetical protein